MTINNKTIWVMVKNGIPCGTYATEERLLTHVGLYYGKAFAQDLWNCHAINTVYVFNEQTYAYYCMKIDDYEMQNT